MGFKPLIQSIFEYVFEEFTNAEERVIGLKEEAELALGILLKIDQESGILCRRKILFRIIKR